LSGVLDSMAGAAAQSVVWPGEHVRVQTVTAVSAQPHDNAVVADLSATRDVTVGGRNGTVLIGLRRQYAVGDRIPVVYDSSGAARDGNGEPLGYWLALILLGGGFVSAAAWAVARYGTDVDLGAGIGDGASRRRAAKTFVSGVALSLLVAMPVSWFGEEAAALIVGGTAARRTGFAVAYLGAVVAGAVISGRVARRRPAVARRRVGN
jgi:hypothetical protein